MHFTCSAVAQSQCLSTNVSVDTPSCILMQELNWLILGRHDLNWRVVCAEGSEHCELECWWLKQCERSEICFFENLSATVLKTLAVIIRISQNTIYHHKSVFKNVTCYCKSTLENADCHMILHYATQLMRECCKRSLYLRCIVKNSFLRY